VAVLAFPGNQLVHSTGISGLTNVHRVGVPQSASGRCIRRRPVSVLAQRTVPRVRHDTMHRCWIRRLGHSLHSIPLMQAPTCFSQPTGVDVPSFGQSLFVGAQTDPSKLWLFRSDPCMDPTRKLYITMYLHSCISIRALTVYGCSIDGITRTGHKCACCS
jgi:hypothetical protein